MARLALAAVAASAALLLSVQGDAEASYGGFADSDGYVPVVSGCWGGSQLGLYSWYSDGYSVSGTITINECALQAMGAGPNDRARVIAHEQGHAAGYGHSYDPASVMYPYSVITGT